MSALATATMSWQDVTRSSFCSGFKECGTKRAQNFLFPKSSFRIRRTTVLGMFKDSAIILDAIQRWFLTKSTTAVSVWLGWGGIRVAGWSFSLLHGYHIYSLVVILKKISPKTYGLHCVYPPPPTISEHKVKLSHLLSKCMELSALGE